MSEGFENYSEAAPEGLWAAVSGTLSRQRRRRRRVFAASSCAAFACAAFAAALLLLPGRSISVPQRHEAAYALVADIPLKLGIAPAGELRPESGTSRSTGEVMPEETLPQPYELLPETEVETEAGAAPQPLPEDTLEGGNTSVPEKDAAIPDFEEDPFADDAPAAAVKRHRNRLALNMSFSGQGDRSSSAEGYGAMYGSGVSAALTSSSPAVGLSVAGPLPEVLLDNNFREVNTDVKHYLPVRFALSLAWEFAPRFSLVSGLGYSRLVSDMSSGTSDSRYDIRQTLHYVGVPLYLNWSLPLAQRLDFCLSAGGMAEKCVDGQSETSYVMDSRQLGQESSRIAVRPLQWSVKASAGLMWRFGDRVGAFVEPGLIYYFDNGSPVETLYGARPLNFDLSLGLRLSFR